MSTQRIPRDDDSKHEVLSEMLGDTAAKLSEHFDSVIILATARDTNCNTQRFTNWRGDDYACYGAAKAFVTKFEGLMKRGKR